MANKQALFGGRVVKVDNKSGFDKSRLNLLTTGVGTITPIAKQLVIPNSDGRVSTSIHAELPPLATNAYLRTHLKVEAFFCPLRLCYGGFESWFSGREIFLSGQDSFGRAELPRGIVPFTYKAQGEAAVNPTDTDFRIYFGASSLSNYFNVNFGTDLALANFPFDQYGTDVVQYNLADGTGIYLNIFPYICYHLIWDHWYRNKTVSRPAFAPPAFNSSDIAGGDINDVIHSKALARHLPYLAFGEKFTIVPDLEFTDGSLAYDIVAGGSSTTTDDLLNGQLYLLRQRNYGDDYFTAAKPNAQEGNPVTVDTSGGSFTISALRAQNALQEFAEVNNYATPDFVQACKARYGATLSNSVAQHPVLLGSADFPMFTKGVEQTAQSPDSGLWPTRNPFMQAGMVGAKAGNASANGQEFVCDFHADEPGYIMLMSTLVPEANYSEGIAHDMTLFTKNGDLTDLPCSLLENIGDEPIMARELYPRDKSRVFGYVQRYLWHKSASPGNEVHGLFVPGQSLDAFAPYRPPFASVPSINSNFLEIPKTALDSVASVNSGISNYGVMLDCAIRLTVSEPLSESALPSLADPAREHGRSVYLANGGSKLA